VVVKAPLIVLLGASGFVGSAVLRELATRPVRVRAVSRRPAIVPEGARAEIEVLPVDLCEPGRMAEAVAGADVVIHAVAYIDGVTTWRVADGDSAAERVTVGLVRDLIEAVRPAVAGDGAPVRVVFTGAASQVGREVIDGTEPDRPAGEYDRQKLAAESALLAAHADGVVRATSIRLPTVFGAGPASTARDKGVVSLMVRRAVAGQDITMWHDGTVRRDLVYIDDVARALVAAAEHADELAGRSWLLGSGHGAPLGEVFTTVAGLVAAETGKPPVQVMSVPAPAHAEAGDFRGVTIDSTAFRAVTGWHPRVPLDEALARTVAHCVQEAEPPRP
jgi:nucleoside-diphosphate-sugar epimerase